METGKTRGLEQDLGDKAKNLRNLGRGIDGGALVLSGFDPVVTTFVLLGEVVWENAKLGYNWMKDLPKSFRGASSRGSQPLPAAA